MDVSFYIKNLKIPIPSIEQQKEIIKQNIKKSKQIISGMVVKSIIDNEPIDEVQNEIALVEEEVIIKKKVKNLLLLLKKTMKYNY